MLALTWSASPYIQLKHRDEGLTDFFDILDDNSLMKDLSIATTFDIC
jgi:hypothetical protein